jgi:hypothetical protein
MRSDSVNLHRRALHRRRFSRRQFAFLALGVAGPLVSSRALAESAVVPAGLQAELLAKVVDYDRNFAARAGDRVRALLVAQASNADSKRAVQQMAVALGRIGDMGGLPHEETIVPYTGAADLARMCRERRIAVVYFGPGFRDDVADIRAALTGVDVLSVASVPDYVKDGIVFGFDLVSGRPKLLLNLPQAKLQNIAMKSALLKLMQVYE